VYKELFEAPGNRALARRIAPGSWVVDVGAGFGFFSIRFSRWVSEGGRVIAIEPDTENLSLLRWRTARCRNLEICAAAAADRAGTVRFQRNPEQPADHRISQTGKEVKAVTVDEIVEASGSPIIGLIKIDTQGSEARVLAGASRTLQRCRPNLLIEIDERALRESGSSAADLLQHLCLLDYQVFQISYFGSERRLSVEAALQALASEKRGYLDLLCIPKAQPVMINVAAVS
jgi:FkbM family methyltransferase